MSTLPSIPRWKTILHALKMGSTPLTKLNQIIYKNGSTVRFHIGGIYPMILTADPDFVQHILQKSQKKYQKSKRHFDKIQHFLGQGILSSEGEYWKKQRRMVQPCFHKKRLKEVINLMDKVTDQFLRDLDKAVAKNKEVDIAEKMREITFRIIANAIFSKDLKEEEFQKISESLPKIQKFIVRLIRQPFLNWWFKWSGEIEKHEKLRDEETAIIQSYIQKRKQSKGEHDDILQMLLDIRYEDGGGMTERQLIDEINVLFIAGHDTSANALSWAWYLLSKHPDILEKLRAEVNQVMSKDEASFEQIAQLDYTEQVIEEALRLYPPIWGTNRVAIEADEFKGIKIKKGTMIAPYVYGVHHSPELWENPEAFQPERHTRDKKKARHAYAFVPFGGGRRMCVGRQFALMEMKLILAKMVKRYEMKLAPNQVVEVLPLLNLQPKNGIKMELKKRKAFQNIYDLVHGMNIRKKAVEERKEAKCPFSFAKEKAMAFLVNQ